MDLQTLSSTVEQGSAEIARSLVARLRSSVILGQVVRFGLVGVMNTFLDFGLFNLFHFGLGMSVVLANTLSVSVGIISSFVCNKLFTFKRRDWRGWRQEASLFLAVSVTGLLISDVGIAVLHPLIGGTTPLVVNLEKVGAMIPSRIWTFLGYRFLAFRHWSTEESG